MSATKEIVFSKLEWNRLKEVSEAGYPREVCGLLFGRMDGQRSYIDRVSVLTNILAPEHAERLAKLKAMGMVDLPEERIGRGGAFEFLIDPQEHVQLVMAAGKENLDQVGLFHTHPDHPARPSATDAAQPMLAGWSNLIVAVDKGQFREVRAYFRADETETFQEQKIIVE